MLYLNNKYTKYYYKLIQKAKDRNLSKGNGVYLEEHHIIPKSLNGSNEPENLVLFTAREHYIAHRLLTKMTDGESHKKMWLALFCMVSANNCYKLSKSKTYEKIRSECGKMNSGKNHVRYGTKHNDETKLKMREKKVGYRMSDDHYSFLSETQKGRVCMNNGIRNYFVKPGDVSLKESEGLVKGKIVVDIHKYNEYKKLRSIQTKERWQKARNLGHTGPYLIKT